MLNAMEVGGIMENTPFGSKGTLVRDSHYEILAQVNTDFRKYLEVTYASELSSSIQESIWNRSLYAADEETHTSYNHYNSIEHHYENFADFTKEILAGLE